MERELLLLGLLRREDMHGYQLTEYITHDMAACTDLKKPTAYYLLDKMAKKGWVTRSEEQVGNRPVRQVYAITAEGEATFQHLLREQLSRYDQVHFADDIAFAFLDTLPREESLALLAHRQNTLAAALEKASAIPTHGGSMQLVIEHQIHHLQSELLWLNGVIDRLTADHAPQQS